MAEIVDWDISTYAKQLPKTPSNQVTKASIEKEQALREQFPLLNGVMASMPCIITDRHGAILVWYLPKILSDYRQVCLFVLTNNSGKLDAS